MHDPLKSMSPTACKSFSSGVRTIVSCEAVGLFMGGCSDSLLFVALAADIALLESDVVCGSASLAS